MNRNGFLEGRKKFKIRQVSKRSLSEKIKGQESYFFHVGVRKKVVFRKVRSVWEGNDWNKPRDQWLQKHVSSVFFDKQLNRREYFLHELNENRFNVFDRMPIISSKYRKVNVPNMDKLLKRKDIWATNNVENRFRS
jgi:hypothetical protein